MLLQVIVKYMLSITNFQRREFKWVLREKVHSVLSDIHAILVVSVLKLSVSDII